MNDAMAKLILDKMTVIESQLERLLNPLSDVDAEEKGMILANAIKTGDKKTLKAAIKQINGGR